MTTKRDSWKKIGTELAKAGEKYYGDYSIPFVVQNALVRRARALIDKDKQKEKDTTVRAGSRL